MFLFEETANYGFQYWILHIIGEGTSILFENAITLIIPSYKRLGAGYRPPLKSKELEL